MITHSPVSALRPLLHILSTIGHYQKKNTDLHHLPKLNQLFKGKKKKREASSNNLMIRSKMLCRNPDMFTIAFFPHE